MPHGHLDYFQKPPLGGRPKAKPRDMALQTLTTRWFIYWIMCKEPHECKFIEIAFGWGPSHIWLHTTWGSMTTLHDVGGGIGTAFGHFSFGLSQFSRSRLVAVSKYGWVTRASSYLELTGGAAQWRQNTSLRKHGRGLVVRLKSLWTLQTEISLASNLGRKSVVLYCFGRVLPFVCSLSHKLVGQ